MALSGYKKKVLRVAAFAVVLSPVTAVPQSVAETQIVPVSYFGRVTQYGGIDIFQPDGSTARYSGPVPQLPVSAGDVVRFKFETELPVGTSGSGVFYSGQKAANGLYDISFHSPALGSAGSGSKSGVNPDPFGHGGGGAKARKTSQVTYDSNTGELTPAEEHKPALAAREEGPGSEPKPPAPPPAEPEPIKEPTSEPKAHVPPGGGMRVAKTSAGDVPPAMSQQQPTPVPAPGMLLIFAAASAALLSRRHPLRRA